MTEIEKVQEWNRHNPVGATVEVEREGGTLEISTTRCEARLSRDRAVVWVRGIAGAYPLEKVRPVSTSPVPVEVKPPASRPSATVPPPAPGWTRLPSMRFEVVPDPTAPAVWRVEAIDRNATEEFYLAIFRGPSAEARAREYADWKNQMRG
jgi:hypothetical protein